MLRWTIAAPILWVLLISSVFYTLTSYWTGRLLSEQLAEMSHDSTLMSSQWHAGLWRSEVEYTLHIATPLGELSRQGRVEVRHNPVWQRDGWVLARFSETHPELQWQALWTLDERLLGSFSLTVPEEPWLGSFSWADDTLDVNGTRSSLLLPEAHLSVAHPFGSLQATAPYDEFHVNLGAQSLATTALGEAPLVSTEPRLSLQIHHFGEAADWYAQWHSAQTQWQRLQAFDTDVQVRLSALPWSSLSASLSDDPTVRLAGWSALLQSEPQLSRFGMRLDAESPYEDFAGMLRMRGAQGLERWQDLDLEFSLLMYDRALYQLLLWQTQNNIVQRGLTPPPAAELTRQVSRELRNIRLMFQLLPLVEVSADKSEVHVQLREGMLYQQGQPIMRLDQLQTLIPR